MAAGKLGGGIHNKAAVMFAPMLRNIPCRTSRLATKRTRRFMLCVYE